VIGPNRRWLGGFVLAAALFPGSARAQELALSFEDLRQTLKVGQRVVVTDESGQKSKGRVDELSTSSFTVGPRTFTEATVTEIRLPAPLWNGALIGEAIDALTTRGGQITLCGASANKGVNDIAADRKTSPSRVRLLPLLSQAALSPTPLLG
jgi:hypothetical protein